MQFGFDRCPYCYSHNGFVYVHGHYQCRVCNNNVMPCCGGEQEQAEDRMEPEQSAEGGLS